MLRSCQLATLVILVCISALAAASNESNSVAAYSNGNELVIVARSGAPIRTVKTPFQIQSFAISPNLQFAALVRATQEARLRNLSAAADDGVFAAIGWLGNQCVVYVSGRDWSDANGKPARVYNLQTKESISLAKLFGIPEETTVGLMDIAGSAWTRREEGGQTKLYVVGEDERLLVNRKGVLTRALGVPERHNHPAECR